jgi:hypothetical protein
VFPLGHLYDGEMSGTVLKIGFSINQSLKGKKGAMRRLLLLFLRFPVGIKDEPSPLFSCSPGTPMNPDFAVKLTGYSALRLTFSGTSINLTPEGWQPNMVLIRYC